MNEQIKAIIDRARALLAPVIEQWVVDSDGGIEATGTLNDGTPGTVHVADFVCPEAADLAAFAVNNLGTLCDALERAQFAAEWWAADRAIDVEAAREAWAVMDSMARAAGMVGTLLEQAAPLMRPDASGNVKAPNYVTATFTDEAQTYEVTIRREGGKTPADIIGEITARAEAAERRAEEAEAQAALRAVLEKHVVCSVCSGSGCRDMECRVVNGRPEHTCDENDRCWACRGAGRDAEMEAALDHLAAVEAERDELLAERDRAARYEKNSAALWSNCVDLLRAENARLSAEVIARQSVPPA